MTNAKVALTRTVSEYAYNQWDVYSFARGTLARPSDVPMGSPRGCLFFCEKSEGTGTGATRFSKEKLN